MLSVPLCWTGTSEFITLFSIFIHIWSSVNGKVHHRLCISNRDSLYLAHSYSQFYDFWQFFKCQMRHDWAHWIIAPDFYHWHLNNYKNLQSKHYSQYIDNSVELPFSSISKERPFFRCRMVRWRTGKISQTLSSALLTFYRNVLIWIHSMKYKI